MNSEDIVRQAVKEAVFTMGSRSELAKAIGCSFSQTYNMEYFGKVPEKFVDTIHKETAIPKHRLAPETFKDIDND
jgi:hypothetical protein